jgi:hypothetical protein
VIATGMGMLAKDIRLGLDLKVFTKTLPPACREDLSSGYGIK